MPQELDTILRLVADGHLSPEEAAPIIEALTGKGSARGSGDDLLHGARERVDAVRRRVAAVRAELDAGQSQRHLRIRVTEHGRQVVNLRIPLGFADAALRLVPGIGEEQAGRIRAAIDSGSIGPILDVEDPDGDGVLISVE